MTSPDLLTEAGQLLVEMREIRRRLPERITFDIQALRRDVLPGLSELEIREACVLACVSAGGMGRKLCVHVDQLPRLRETAMQVLRKRTGQ